MINTDTFFMAAEGIAQDAHARIRQVAREIAREIQRPQSREEAAKIAEKLREHSYGAENWECTLMHNGEVLLRQKWGL